MFFYNTDWKDFKKVYPKKPQEYCSKTLEDIDVIYIKGFFEDGMISELPNIKT